MIHGLVKKLWALAPRGLCDELAAHDVLLDFVDKGYYAFSLPRGSSSSRADEDQAGMNGWQGVLKSMVRGVVS